MIGYLDSQVALGNNEQGIPWYKFLAESRGHYLSLDHEFSDHSTWQAISELYNIQIIVVSTLNHGTTLVRPDESSSVSDSLCSVGDRAVPAPGRPTLTRDIIIII